MNRAGKIVDTLWFSNCIGFVKVQQSDQEIKYYVGYVDHEDLTEGAYEIALWGFEFPKSPGDVLFNKGGVDGL